MNTKIIGLFSLLAINCFAAPDYYNHLLRFEGFRDTVYLDSEGIKTVGYGTNLESRGLNYKVGTKISKADLNKFAKEDINKYENVCRKHILGFDKLPDVAKEISFGLAYNVGESGFMKFKNFRLAMGKKDYKSAAQELKRSKWFSQVKQRGISYFNELNRA